MQPPVRRLDRHAGVAQRLDGRFHFLELGALQRHLAAGDRRGAGVGAGLDPVGHHFVGRAVQPGHPVDRQLGRADAFDLGAHRLQQVAQVDDLGLARGIVEHAAARPEHRVHDRVLGRPDRDDRKAEPAAGQAAVRRDRADVARGEFDMGAERLQRLQVQVDRPIADRATAGQRHGRLAGAREQRAQNEDRRAHLAHQVVRRDA